jgi:hypothetical protein
MVARAVDEAAERLRELRHEEWEDLGLAGVAVALAVAATLARPSLAMPLFLGGIGVAALGVRALWRRWDLLDRLSGERDAYAIPEVLACATAQATIDRRRSYAALIRSRLAHPGMAGDPRRSVAGDELEALAAELEDADLALDPAAAVACARLLTDLDGSPLLNPALPPEELRSRVRRIRAGFEGRDRPG